MTPRLERILHVAAWSNLVGTLIVLIMMGLARDAQAAQAIQLVTWPDKALIDLWHFTVSLIYGVVAIAVLFGVLRYRDKLLGVNFKTDVIGKIHRSGMATAVYYSVWVGAGAYIIGRAFA